MSDDLVKRLLHSANEVYGTHPCGLMSEAADRIEAQAARIAELEAALRGLLTPQTPAAFADAMRVARAALEGGER